MKKLMKSATLLASVGAMLCCVGCGKENTGKSTVTDTKSASPNGITKEVTTPQVPLSPVEEMVSLVRNINAELAKHGAKPLASDEDLTNIRKNMPSEEAKKQLARMKPTLPLLVSYSNAIKNINNLCTDIGENPYLDKEKITNAFESFIKETPEEQQVIVSRMKSGFSLLQVYVSINNLCREMEGSPYIAKENIIGKLRDFMETTEEEQVATVSRMKSGFSSLQVYASIVKDVNDLCKKMGGNPYLDKNDITRNFERFLSKSTNAQQEAIFEAKEVLKSFKDAKK